MRFYAGVDNLKPTGRVASHLQAPTLGSRCSHKINTERLRSPHQGLAITRLYCDHKNVCVLTLSIVEGIRSPQQQPMRHLTSLTCENTNKSKNSKNTKAVLYQWYCRGFQDEQYVPSV